MDLPRTLRLEAQDTVNDPRPQLMAVLHDDEGGTSGIHYTVDGLDDLALTSGIKVGGGFIQQDEPGTHGDDTGQRQALFLSTGEVPGGMVQWQVETDHVQSLFHAWPDLLPRDAEVLAAEGDIITDPGGDDLGIGVLENEAGGGGVDKQGTVRLPFRVITEHAGQRGEQG